jgi:diguanylate cyclase (GGDEF)-like protein
MWPGSTTSPVLVNRALRQALGHYLESADTITVLIDAKGRPEAANPAFERLGPRRLSLDSLFEMVLPAHRQALEEAIAAAHSSHEAVLEQFDLAVEGRTIPCDCIVVEAGRQSTLILAEPLRRDLELPPTDSDLAQELGATRAALELKSAELRAVMVQAEELAHTDSLTLLPNRRSIIADLQRQVLYAERYETPLAVSMLDLDGFKAVNDQLGHAAGDQVLVAVASGLRDRIRQPDEIGRYGGDEFLVVLPNVAASAASQQAERLCQYVRSADLPGVDAPATRVTLSAGITQFKRGDDDWHTLIERADRALYEAKHQGGDRWLILES